MFLPDEKLGCLQFLLQDYGLLTKKNHFGGYAVLVNQIMIGIAVNGEFYVRGCLVAQMHFESIGMNKLVYTQKGIPLALKYYHISSAIWKNDQQLKFYLSLAYQSAKEVQVKKQIPNERIKDLPNLNLAAERALGKIGVFHVAQLKLLGAKACYLKLRQKSQSHASLKTLFELAGAIEGYHIAVLPEEMKQELIRWFNQLV